MNPGQDSLRLDKWLWYARLCKSRNLAAKLCRSGRVRVNKLPIEKPHHALKPGDVVTAPIGAGVRVLEVVALGERRGPAVEARLLYTDLTPVERAPASEQGQRMPGSGRPTKRQRREIDRLRAACD